MKLVFTPAFIFAYQPKKKPPVKPFDIRYRLGEPTWLMLNMASSEEVAKGKKECPAQDSSLRYHGAMITWLGRSDHNVEY